MFTFTGDTASIEFMDWQQRRVRISCEGTIAIKWQALQPSVPDERDDAVYEILESAWIGEHARQHAVGLSEGYRHFSLRFNGIGMLEIICKRMLVGDMPSASSRPA